jgi:hypothetical protein
MEHRTSIFRVEEQELYDVEYSLENSSEMGLFNLDESGVTSGWTSACNSMF